MFPGRLNKTGLKIIYSIIVIVTLVLIFKGGKKQDDSKGSIEKNAWEMISPTDNNNEIALEHLNIVKDYHDMRKNNFNFTNLGRILFLNENRPPKRDKQYKILVYKKGPQMERRHLYYYGNVKHDPFEFCETKNCILSYDDADFSTADAVIFHLHTFNKEYNTPKNISRPPGQRWVFTSDESPQNTFMLQANEWWKYDGIFNWSMMYRLESDVPVACGRVVPLGEPVIVPPTMNFEEKFEMLVPNAKEKRRDVLVAIMSSNCRANKRIDYVHEMQKYMKVDVYGACGTEELKKLCPWKSYGVECDELKKYLFYLSFDNSNCNGYITEKFFSHALKLGNVPIFMGMYKKHSDLLAPPNSYLHVESFQNPKELAEFILHINSTFEENYLKYHEWRKDFESLSEDGYMGARSYHYCRLCEALNYNDETPKVYYKEDLAKFLDPDRNCHKSVW